MNACFPEVCRRVAFASLATLVVAMAVGTFAFGEIYEAWWFVALWVVASLSGAVWLFHATRREMRHVRWFHLSLLVVLLGACVSFFTAESGTLPLRIDRPTELYADGKREGRVGHLPFEVTLRDFRIVCDSATATPLDYVSRLELRDADGEVCEKQISMNHSLLYKGIRLWQQSYDADCCGVVLGVRKDMPGTWLSYSGYALLMASFIWTLLSRRGGLRLLMDTETKPRSITASRRPGSIVVLSVLLVASTAELIYRGMMRGRLPMTDEAEVLMTGAWMAMLVTLFSAFFRHKGEMMQLLNRLGWAVALPLLLLRLALYPPRAEVRPLAAILDTPLLDVHVTLVILAYVLLTLTFCCSLATLLGVRFRAWNSEREERAARLSRLLLYPALASLAVGIFLGAVWAGEAWGRYWGWDPKETWALITLLVYALPMHRRSLPRFAVARFHHLYMLLAFSAVAMTFFGVNRLLAGLHSYA